MDSATPKQTLAGAVAWAENAVSATVTGVRPLTGGLSAGMVGLETTAGQFALRWWEHPGPWPSLCLARQSAVLDALMGSGLPTPECVASDDMVPASLTSWLPGTVDLNPVNPQRWLTSLAQTLAQIHQVPPPPTLPLSDSAADPKLQSNLDWLDDPGLAAETRALIATPQTDPSALLHGDYQHFNVVWDDDHLSGIIDWPLGGAGDPGLDVGHCRLNLAVLYGAGTAMDFLEHYEAAAGSRVSAAADLTELLAYSPAWPNFIPTQVAGRRAVDGPGMASQVRSTAIETLRRAG